MALTQTAFIKWFERFLEEKELSYQTWEIKDSQGVTHILDSDVLIEQVKFAPIHEQAQIKQTIVKIDFLNGDVNHFFKHLVGALVEQSIKPVHNEQIASVIDEKAEQLELAF